jgi:hypothetical protein
MISLDDLYAVVKTASAPAPQDTPGGQAMAAAAKMAAPPGAPPMPQPIEQPQQEAAADPTAEQQKHLADIAKKDKEIGDLRAKTQELKLDIQRMQMTSELQKQQQAMLDKVRNEQKLLDKKQTEFTSAEAAHKANLEKETARHEVMRAKADAKSLADIARRDADSIKSNAEQNAKNYVKMVEDARKTTDSYMASKEKAFAQTQEAAKKNSPYVSVSLRSNIDSALAAAKNIGKLRSRIAKDDIKFNKAASQGSAGSSGSSPSANDLAAELATEEAGENASAYKEMMHNEVQRFSNLGTSENDANSEYNRLIGLSQRNDIQGSALMRDVASQAKQNAKETLDSRKAKNQEIIANKGNQYSQDQINAAYADRGRVQMAGKSYSGLFGEQVMEDANTQMQRAGLHNTTVGAWKQQQQQATEQADKDRPWYASVGNFLGDMVTGIYTGPRDAILNGMKASDAADAFNVNRNWSGGVEGKNGNTSTVAMRNYAAQEGLSTNMWKDVGNIALQTGLSIASFIPVGGAIAAGVGGVARAAVGAAARQAAKQGIKAFASNAVKQVGKGAWNAGKSMFLGGNKSVMQGAFGAGKTFNSSIGKGIQKAVNSSRGQSILGNLDTFRNTMYGIQGVNMVSNLMGKGNIAPDWMTGQMGIQDGGSFDVGGTREEQAMAFQQQQQESNPYSVLGQGVHSASAKITDPFTKYAAILGAYDWEDNDTAERLKVQSQNVYTNSTMGRAAAFLSPFISSATGGRVKLAPDYNLPVPTPKKFDVARAMSDFSTQHWRPTFNPEADKSPTPMMDFTLKQFHAAQKAKGDPWTYQYRHSQLGGMSSAFDDSRHNLSALLDLVHGM